MNCDDIFCPAVDGDLTLLRQRLDMEQVDLNEPVDCGINNGVHTTVPLLFSIMNRMREQGQIRYDVLELLLQYGMNPNGYVVLKDDASEMRIPLILYPLLDWKNVELLEFLLAHGAKADINRRTQYSTGAFENFTMLHFAIQFCTVKEMELLLHYGADPNSISYMYAQEQACQQMLPVLYFATAVQQSAEKTELLLSYGARTDETVEMEGTITTRYIFAYYLSTYYGSAYNLLCSCVAKLQGTPKRAAIAPSELPKVKKQASVQRKKDTGSTDKSQQTKKPRSTLDQIRRKVKELIRFEQEHTKEYDRWNKGKKLPQQMYWLLGISAVFLLFFLFDLFVRHSFSFLVFILMAVPAGAFIYFHRGDKKYAKQCQDGLNQLLTKRQQLVDELNALASGKKLSAWWNDVKPFEYTTVEAGSCAPLIWMPSERLFMKKGDEKVTLRGFCMEADVITGDSIEKMMASGDYRVLFNHGIHGQNYYKIADLCEWTVIDGTYTYQTSASEEAIARDLKTFEDKQDDRERFWNLWEHGLFCMTDEERYLCAQMGYTDMSYADLAESRMWRYHRTKRYEEKLRKATYTHTEDVNMYVHTIESVGVIVFDQNGQIQSVMLKRKAFQSEMYYTNLNKWVYRVYVDDVSRDPKTSDFDVIRRLREFPLQEQDVLAPTPEGFSQKEWIAYLYSCCYKGDIQESIAAWYRQAQESKKKKLR